MGVVGPMSAELRTSQVEVLRLIRDNGSAACDHPSCASVSALRVALDCGRDEASTERNCKRLAHLGYLSTVGSHPTLGLRPRYRLTQLGHEALEGEG